MIRQQMSQSLQDCSSCDGLLIRPGRQMLVSIRHRGCCHVGSNLNKKRAPISKFFGDLGML